MSFIGASARNPQNAFLEDILNQVGSVHDVSGHHNRESAYTLLQSLLDTSHLVLNKAPSDWEMRGIVGSVKDPKKVWSMVMNEIFGMESCQSSALDLPERQISRVGLLSSWLSNLGTPSQSAQMRPPVLNFQRPRGPSSQMHKFGFTFPDPNRKNYLLRTVTMNQTPYSFSLSVDYPLHHTSFRHANPLMDLYVISLFGPALWIIAPMSDYNVAVLSDKISSSIGMGETNLLLQNLRDLVVFVTPEPCSFLIPAGSLYLKISLQLHAWAYEDIVRYNSIRFLERNSKMYFSHVSTMMKKREGGTQTQVIPDLRPEEKMGLEKVYKTVLCGVGVWYKYLKQLVIQTRFREGLVVGKWIEGSTQQMERWKRLLEGQVTLVTIQNTHITAIRSSGLEKALKSLDESEESEEGRPEEEEEE